MKFLKRFKELNESKEGQKELIFIYTTCDETYGSVYWNVSNEFPEEYVIDDSPCRFSTEDYIVSEDDENREKEEEILAKQTGGVWDPKYDYDYDEEEISAWRENTINAWIDQYMGSDLWGSVYLLFGENLTNTWDQAATDIGRYGRMPTKEEFETDELTHANGVEAWVDVNVSAGQGSSYVEKIASVFSSQLQDRPAAIVRMLNSMKKSLAERLLAEMGKNPEIDIKNLRSLMKASEIGLL